ncbi:MAG: arsenate reductase [Undibacterium sp.]|nr:arsenate reductase [Undibacterium sp.]
MSHPPRITLFGIPNCDTVKKARTWLEQRDIDYDFHNFKKDGLQSSTINAWLTQTELSVLINRKGNTWRTLSDEQKLLADKTADAITLMQTHSSIIKRPVLQIGDTVITQLCVGFSDAQYQTIFSSLA